MTIKFESELPKLQLSTLISEVLSDEGCSHVKESLLSKIRPTKVGSQQQQHEHYLQNEYFNTDLHHYASTKNYSCQITYQNAYINYFKPNDSIQTFSSSSNNTKLCPFPKCFKQSNTFATVSFEQLLPNLDKAITIF